MFTKDTLKEKSILITGGGSGLGFSMAERFAELGANVAICGRTEEKLVNAAEKLNRFGTKIITHVVDVRDYDRVGKMIDRLVEEFGSLEGLVNNAAGNFVSPSEDLSPNGFKAVVDIVLHGTFNCSQHFGRYLIHSERKGCILNIVTTYTQFGSAFVMPSAVAKAGVETMTKSLAYEWATYGIRVNAIAPGPFPTKGAWSRLMPDPRIEKIYLERIPTHRYGEHIELANLAVFLMSDLAPYLTGETVIIDGAEHLQAGQFNFLTQLMPREELKKVFAEYKSRRKSKK
ncbi:putative 2,4-dienoyl-CoA reductase [bacterium BMS3Abin05]|nr:putative 2,4-dienoyl-CoA reductase [bacterium BMS3Abin05]GBE28309.1 putative 2,4-dienoyl-CoA reductase [bacterium BMS3Bbin03]